MALEREDDEYEYEDDDLEAEFRDGILGAFPDLSDEQIASLKTAFEACVEQKTRASEPAMPGPKASKPAGGLALIFGSGKGKR